MDITPNDSHLTPQNLRLRQFLGWLIPIAIGFALLEAAVFLIYPLFEIGATAALTSGYLLCLLIARRRLSDGQITRAVYLLCVGILVAASLAVTVWPTLLPALILLLVVAVAIALPYLDGSA